MPPPTGCEYIGNIETLRLLDLCDQHLNDPVSHEAIGVDVSDGLGENRSNSVVPWSEEDEHDGKPEEYELDENRSNSVVSRSKGSLNNLPEGPYMFPVVFKPSYEIIIEEFNKDKGVIQDRKFKRKLSVKQNRHSKSGKIGDGLAKLELLRFRDAAPDLEMKSAREAFKLYAKVHRLQVSDDAFTEWYKDLCNKSEDVRPAIQRKEEEKRGTCEHYDMRRLNRI